MLDLDGVSMTNAGGSYLGVSRFDPIFAELPRRAAVRACRRHDPIRRLALAIFGEMNVIAGAQERGAFADALPRLYWDTASAFSDPVLHMLRSVTGLGNVVFGTDYTYPHDAISIAGPRSFRPPLSWTTASAAAFWVGRPLD